MRLIDADVLKQHIDKLPALPDGNFAGNHSALKALINMQPTIPSTNCSEFPNNSDTISRKAANEAIEKCHKQCCRIDSCGDEWIHYETTLNEVESIPPMPSYTSNALKALNSVNATQSNALDSISRAKAIDALNRECRCGAEIDHCGLETAMDIISELPPAQPEHIIHCKDCAKHNKRIGDYEELPVGGKWIWKEDACPLIEFRGKAQGHEFDYQFCAYGERKTE